jgi:hypothetical protein
MKIHSKTICYILIILIVGYLVYKITENSSKFVISANPTKPIYLYNMCNHYTVKALYNNRGEDVDNRLVQTINLNGNMRFSFNGSVFRGGKNVNRDIYFPYEYLKAGDIIYIIDLPTPVREFETWYTPRFLIYRDGYVGGYINKQFIPGWNWFEKI